MGAERVRFESRSHCHAGHRRWNTLRRLGNGAIGSGKLVIGQEGKGIAKIYKFGVLYLYEHYLSGENLLTAHWDVRAGRPIVGMTGFGEIRKARSPQWNGTRFNCKITKAYTWFDAAIEHAAKGKG